MKLLHRIEGNNVLVVELREDNLDAGNVSAFKEEIQHLIVDLTRVVLDMHGVKFIDSSGLGALISCLRQLNARQGDVRLCRMSPSVTALFELMRMNRVFGIHASCEEAVASYG